MIDFEVESTSVSYFVWMKFPKLFDFEEFHGEVRLALTNLVMDRGYSPGVVDDFGWLLEQCHIEDEYIVIGIKFELNKA